MRCKACDSRLTNTDTSRKSLVTGEYIDLCSKCFSYIAEDISVEENITHLDGEEDDESSSL